MHKNKKICKGCGRNRRLGKFGKLSVSSDGKNYYCIECMRAYNSRYKRSSIGRLRQNKSTKIWKEKNKNHIKSYNEKYYIENKRRILFNKESREKTESILIYDEIPKKTKQKKINKNKEYNIVINPQRR